LQPSSHEAGRTRAGPLRLRSQRSISPRRGSRRAQRTAVGTNTVAEKSWWIVEEFGLIHRFSPAAFHQSFPVFNPSVDSRLAGSGRCRGSTTSRDVLAGGQPPPGAKWGPLAPVTGPVEEMERSPPSSRYSPRRALVGQHHRRGVLALVRARLDRQVDCQLLGLMPFRSDIRGRP
jgi:hypothetical protein